jgi:hypothetical protein
MITRHTGNWFAVAALMWWLPALGFLALVASAADKEAKR